MGGGSEWADDPRLSAKGPLSQVKESIWACNKIKISFHLNQSLLPNDDDVDDVGCTADNLAQHEGNEECRQAIADCLADPSSMAADQQQQPSPQHAAAASKTSILLINFNWLWTLKHVNICD